MEESRWIHRLNLGQNGVGFQVHNKCLMNCLVEVTLTPSCKNARMITDCIRSSRRRREAQALLMLFVVALGVTLSIVLIILIQVSLNSLIIFEHIVGEVEG